MTKAKARQRAKAKAGQKAKKREATAGHAGSREDEEARGREALHPSEASMGRAGAA